MNTDINLIDMVYKSGEMALNDVYYIQGISILLYDVQFDLISEFGEAGAKSFSSCSNCNSS